MPKGVTVNCSMVEQDGKYEIGFHYKDSDGINVEKKANGEDYESLIYDIFDDVLEDISKQQAAQKKKVEEKKDPYVAQLEKIIEDLTYENNSLKTDLNILQKRADEAVNKKAPKVEAKKAPVKETKKYDNKIHYESIYNKMLKELNDYLGKF